jgi:uncharacterized protein YyaL (SSP411 family)
MNELSTETSPYLLQHANNPVYWKAWNDQSLAKAKSENKLIIISIGYSACHWCHVMEHESFEDDDVAKTMNDHFVSIKIDREERPDIDAVYMKAVQMMTGHGGWPMNVIALPDGRPVWGGTYFRKNEWINALWQLQQLFKTDPKQMTDYAEQLQSGIENISLIINKNSTAELSQDLMTPLINKWKRSFDNEFGGMARAPKFMMPDSLEFLMRYGTEYNDAELLNFVDLTLTRMAWGGLFDPLGGGFSRYSVDMKWHVPHFEKMLYDNGQLVSLYANAYKRTQNPLYKEVIEKTLQFVTREWLTRDGAFYSALDADSLDESQHLEEGAFYVWKKNELRELLDEDLELFSLVFNINSFGHWEKDHYVLIQNQPLEKIANDNNIDIAKLQSKKKLWEGLLFRERQKRSMPRLDDKCLTSWNAIMLKGFVDAYKALQNEDYLKTALQNAAFLVKNQWSPEGHLWHSFKEGKRSINGFLEDYAHVIAGFISLYEVTFNEQWLQYAKQLADYTLEHFYEVTNGFFAFTSDTDTALIVRHFETEDNVIPASNSVMAHNLFRLGTYFNNAHYEKICTNMVRHIVPEIDYPSAFSNWLNAFLNFSEKHTQLAICGTDALAHNKEITAQYLPHVIIAGAENKSALPFLEYRYDENKTLFYVCHDKTCDAPQTDFEKTVRELKSNVKST